MEIFDEQMQIWRYVGDGTMSNPGSDEPDRGAEHETQFYPEELQSYKTRHPMPKLADAMLDAGKEYQYLNNEQYHNYIREGES